MIEFWLIFKARLLIEVVYSNSDHIKNCKNSLCISMSSSKFGNICWIFSNGIICFLFIGFRNTWKVKWMNKRHKNGQQILIIFRYSIYTRRYVPINLTWNSQVSNKSEKSIKTDTYLFKDLQMPNVRFFCVNEF